MQSTSETEKHAGPTHWCGHEVQSRLPASSTAPTGRWLRHQVGLAFKLAAGHAGSTWCCTLARLPARLVRSKVVRAQQQMGLTFKLAAGHAGSTWCKLEYKLGRIAS
eukprot:225876-Pelagomonas_calceolata.AAC.6